MTGASGTGKSSLLSAWVIPKLKREKHVVIQLRGYEDDLFARIKDELLRPRAIWDKAPGKTDDLGLLLERAACVSAIAAFSSSSISSKNF